MRSIAIVLLLTGAAYATDLRDGAPCAHRWIDKDGHAVTIIVDGECVYAQRHHCFVVVNPNGGPDHWSRSQCKKIMGF